MFMKSTLVLCASLGMVLVLGNGCSKNNPPEIHTVIPQEQESEPIVNDPVARNLTPQDVQEPELNTPYMRDMEELKQWQEMIAASYFFVVENKNNDFGKNSDYGILGVKMDCSAFYPLELSKDQEVNLERYKNKAIVLAHYTRYHNEYTFQEIEEDTAHKKEIEALKRTCTEPFKRYME